MAKKKKAAKKRSAPTKACPHCGKPNHPRRKLCEHCGKPTVAVKKPSKKRTAVNVGVGSTRTYSRTASKLKTEDIERYAALPNHGELLRLAAMLFAGCGMDRDAANWAINEVAAIHRYLGSPSKK